MGGGWGGWGSPHLSVKHPVADEDDVSEDGERPFRSSAAG